MMPGRAYCDLMALCPTQHGGTPLPSDQTPMYQACHANVPVSLLTHNTNTPTRTANHSDTCPQQSAMAPTRHNIKQQARRCRKAVLHTAISSAVLLSTTDRHASQRSHLNWLCTERQGTVAGANHATGVSCYALASQKSNTEVPQHSTLVH